VGHHPPGLAIVHFIRRRPDNYWIFVILFLGPLGAIIYLAAEALPDIGLLGQSFKVFPRVSAFANWKLRFATIRRLETMKNLRPYMDDGKLELRELRLTKRSPPARTRWTLFTGVVFALFS